MKRSWIKEVWRLVVLLLAALLTGLLVGQVLWLLLIAVTAYLVWHIRNLYELERWLSGKHKGYPGERGGLWGDVNDALYQMHRRNNKRKKRLSSILSRFRKSTDAMPDATVVLDEQGNIEWWNRESKRIFGLKSSLDAGQPLANLVRTPEFVEFMRSGGSQERIEMVSPVDEDIHLSVRIIPYGNKQRLLVARDITRLHQLEQMRQDFIANVSHELRTPITVISGYLEALADEPVDTPPVEWKKTLTVMQKQSQRMEDIVRDLLLLTRLETESQTLREQHVNVSALLDMVRDNAMVLGHNQQQVTLEMDRTLYLKGSHDELYSVFSNLVNNAVRYTPEDGLIDLSWYQKDGKAIFSVRDSGIGIAAHNIVRLTERFYRVDVGRSRDSGGTGLGLAIVKHILNRHQAELGIKSTPGKGSTFLVEFPAARTREVDDENQRT
ncbi:MAG TPA: phosphate regulon sensor histidine kinase PhoR [Gammaproteobacteria bacterium]|nr:phosphate regulon sensor histidine kinase PhoR [Gammaproteobacteria bacterium]